MKKKLLSICLVAIIAVVAVAGVSLAYLTDTDEANNVFVIGNVKIQQNEYERVKDEDGKFTNAIKDYTNPQLVYPAVYELPGGDPARMTGLVVGDYTVNFGIRTFPNYVDKLVTVENTGNSPAYVRTIIAVPVVPNDSDADNDISQAWIHWNAIHNGDTTPASGWYYGTTENKELYPNDYADHYIVRNVEIDGKYYDLSVITNVNVLDPGEETAPNMVGYYLDNDLNCDEDGYYMMNGDNKIYVITADEINAEGYTAQLIRVATQAVQAQGFADAWQAFAASFGEITATNHPWYEEELPAA